MRAFLANYLLGDGTALPINKISALGLADADVRHYETVNKGPFDLTDANKTAKLRQEFLAAANASGPNVALVKTHCFNGTINGTSLIPAPITRGALYIIRHPGDVALSYANHYGKSVDEVIDQMAEKRAVVGGTGRSVIQFTSDWSTNVSSWADSKTVNAKVIRYEDMIDAPRKTFGDALKHLGVKVDAKKLSAAIKHSAFKALQEQEAETGFAENTPHQPKFFRSGTAGSWKDELSAEQIERLQSSHNKAMKDYGYL